MVRRFFISAFPSVIALTASALDPAAAAATQNATVQTRMPSFPLPDPIVLDSATVDRARRLLDAVAHGTFDRSELAPQLGDVSPDFFAKGAGYSTGQRNASFSLLAGVLYCKVLRGRWFSLSATRLRSA
jgi:hypothetical protein